MQQANAVSFVAEYGRIGAKPMKKTYPMSSWDKVYFQKIDKGYVDNSDVHYTGIQKKKDNCSGIKNDIVRNFFEDIMRYANQFLAESYTISYDEVSPDMIRKAKRMFSFIKRDKTTDSVNRHLIKLFGIIPRRMSNVADYLISNMDEVQEVLLREQNILDVMEARISENIQCNDTEDTEILDDTCILDTLGLSIEEVTDKKRIEEVMSHLGSRTVAAMTDKIFRVHNYQTDKRFYEHMKKNGYKNKDIHYFYHGSRNENWYGLMTQGPKLNPDAIITGKMFGHGLYYANDAHKSFGYTSKGKWTDGNNGCVGYLAVYKVVFNHPYDVYDWKPAYTDINPKSIVRDYHADALWAHSDKGMLLKDEIIVYDEAQVTLQYIIKLV
jgi:poly [ADP-ribose] polymerase